jgi:hypothetical protein
MSADPHVEIFGVADVEAAIGAVKHIRPKAHGPRKTEREGFDKLSPNGFGGSLGARQRHLGDLDAAAAEAAFAIHEIVAPEAVEGRIEAGGKAIGGDGLLVAGAPALERLRIMGAVAAAVLPGEAGLLGDAAKARLLDE